MSEPAQKDQPQGEAEVILFDQKGEIERLTLLVEKLTKDNSRLRRSLSLRRQDRREILVQSEARGTFIRNMAQEYFSQDPKSFWFAGEALKRSVTREEAIARWRDLGGPEVFARQFPTPEKVMRYFRKLHAVHKGALELTHPILG